MVDAIFEGKNWAQVPFHFWSVVMFVFGTMVGSFLNVCIYRMPLGLSVVSPPSHCPHCKYSIPWYLNVPLVTWLYLRGRCRQCSAPITPRYFLVELLTGICFLGCWLAFGPRSPWLGLVYCLLLAGLIAATFIDFEHFIIPDEITLGGAGAGFVLSMLVPQMHGTTALIPAMQQSLLGIAAGAGVVYMVLRLGKLFFGRQKFSLQEGSRVLFTETCIELPDKSISYEELFYRESDAIALHAKRLELIDRCYQDVSVRLSPKMLSIGEEKLDPETIPHMEAICGQIVVPREAMGLGDVKFMAAIGAFLGWKAVLFSLLISSFIGAMIGLTLVILGRKALSSRLPYGPYIAIAAVIWLFAGPQIIEWYQDLLTGPIR